ncbi:MAG: hypothetical protein R3E97_22150 [Candidatus Eisenbacteria bacterium]
MLRFSDLRPSCFRRTGSIGPWLNRRSLPTTLATLAASCALLALPHESTAERLTNAEITIVSFGSVSGEVTDCGCRAHPKGGLDIRSGYVDWLREENVPFLHVDLGNFTAVKDNTRSLLTHFLWDAMEEMDVDGDAGPRELEYWSRQLRPHANTTISRGPPSNACDGGRTLGSYGRSSSSGTV